MKNIILVFCCFLGTGVVCVHAQTNVNIEKINKKNIIKNAPRFIEDIELVQIPAQSSSVAEDVLPKINPVSLPVLPSSTESGIENFTSLQFKYAIRTNNYVEAISNLPLFKYIDEWWSTRYRYGGSDKSGIDCSAFAGGLISAVYNIELPRTAREQYSVCEKINREDLKEGDLVFFNTRGGVSHVGVYLANNYFVHSSVNAGVTISSLEEDYYSRKFISGGRIFR